MNWLFNITLIDIVVVGLAILGIFIFISVKGKAGGFIAILAAALSATIFFFKTQKNKNKKIQEIDNKIKEYEQEAKQLDKGIKETKDKKKKIDDNVNMIEEELSKTKEEINKIKKDKITKDNAKSYVKDFIDS